MKSSMMRKLLAGFLLLSAPLAYAEDGGWQDETGKLAPNTESRISKNGFGGWLVVTSDANWKEKWETSPNTVPRFNTAATVKKGEQLTVLIFFVNPKGDGKNNADITCDIQSIRPDGSQSIDQKDVVCYRGKIEGSPHNIRLSAPVIKYIGEENDPVGKWAIRVLIKDNTRRVQLPLKTSFTLK